jgi:uncharacterized protein (TIGR03437 family)
VAFRYNSPMKSYFYLYRLIPIILFLTLSWCAYAQKPTTCVVSAAAPIVHSEGLAERIGDIVLQCSGAPGAVVSGNLNVFLPVAITNEVNASGYATGASLSIDTGTGSVPSGVSGLVANDSISFNGFQFTLPASGTASLTIDDVRANVNQLGLEQQSPIYANLGGSLALQNNPVAVASAQQGLLATNMDTAVTCVGSPTPSSLSLGNLFSAQTAVATTRVTEGFPASFQPKDPTSDTGTRFLLSYSNVPANAAIYVPDAVAGSGALVPTSGGDLGTPAAVGQYAQSSQTLLLVRVLNTDSTGLGGTFVTLPAPNSSGVLVLNGANPVPLTGGAGYAVYEVVAANPSAVESAQIPNFFSIPANSPPSTSNGTLSLAPVSTVGSASTTAPVPRFVAVTPPSDCAAVGDCSANYYPKLQATATTLQATAVAGGPNFAVGNITIRNTGGGVLDWSASVTYASGAGWLTFTQPFGVDGALIQVFADPAALAPGTYQATVLIDAGPIAGSQSFPLTLTVTAAAPVTAPEPTPAPAVVITSVTDAADFHPGPVAPGSLASVWGSNLAGQNVSVTFNGMAAKLFYTGAQQINLQIPAALSGQSSAQMVVTVDSASSAPFNVALTSVAPAIFTPGILNQDNTVNSPTNPAPLGTILQIFLTGMPDTGAVATVTIQSRNLVPLYAGAAPGLLGLEQVNVAVPPDLQGVTSTLTICVMGAGNQPYCSQPESIALKP